MIVIHIFHLVVFTKVFALIMSKHRATGAPKEKPFLGRIFYLDIASNPALKGKLHYCIKHLGGVSASADSLCTS